VVHHALMAVLDPLFEQLKERDISLWHDVAGRP
jgi:hypothetical protein